MNKTSPVFASAAVIGFAPAQTVVATLSSGQINLPVNSLRKGASTAPCFALLLASILMSSVITSRLAQAQTFSVLYSFQGGATGRAPVARLIDDSAGNLYGTTQYGGDINEYGLVYKLDASGKETVLYIFTGGADGWYPEAGLIRDAEDNLYGTTMNGGAFQYGTVFKLDASGTKTILHSFRGGADGWSPVADLIRDTSGNLYGATKGSGLTSPSGVVFKLDPGGEETVLHTFTGRRTAARQWRVCFATQTAISMEQPSLAVPIILG